jgi:hypothetical protein
VPATRHSGKRPFPECQGQGTRGRGHLFRVLGLGTRGRAFPIFLNGSVCLRRQMELFFFVCPSSPSVALGEDGLPRVPFFPECFALSGTRGRPSSPSAILPRVQHSGKIVFPECPIFGTRGRTWHSGNIASPVVKGFTAKYQAIRSADPTARRGLRRGHSP